MQETYTQGLSYNLIKKAIEGDEPWYQLYEVTAFK